MSADLNKKILDASKLSLILDRLASQLFENHSDFSNTVIIGIQPRGKILSEKIKSLLETNFGIKNINLGFLDITKIPPPVLFIILTALIKFFSKLSISLC